MVFTKKKYAAVAIVAGVLVAATATIASATPQGQAIVSSLVKIAGGAFDLNGNPVESKTYVGDTPPEDLGELQFEGSATPNQ